MIPTQHVLVLLSILFCIGLVGIFTRKNLIVVLMCIELMWNAVNINFIIFSRDLGLVTGYVFAMFVMAVSAAETAIALALILAVYSQKDSVDTDQLDLLRR